MLRFTREGASPVRVQIADLVIGGMTARDEAAIKHHVEEMAAIDPVLGRTIRHRYAIDALPMLR